MRFFQGLYGLFFTLLSCGMVFSVQAQSAPAPFVQVAPETHQANKQVVFDYFSSLLTAQTTKDLSLYEVSLLTDLFPEDAQKEDKEYLSSSEVKFITEAVMVSLLGWSAAQVIYMGAQSIASTVPAHLPVSFTPKEQILIRQPDSFWMYVSSDIHGQMPHLDALLEKIDYAVISNERVVVDYPTIWESPVFAGDMPTLQNQRVVLDFDQFHRLIRKASLLPPQQGAQFVNDMLVKRVARESLLESSPVFEKIAKNYIHDSGLSMYAPNSLTKKYATFFRANQRWIKWGTRAALVSTALIYYAFHSPHDTRFSFLNPQLFFAFFEAFNVSLMSEDFSQLHSLLDEQPYLTSLVAQYLRSIPKEILTYQQLMTSLAK